jgi:hypothetical protein
LKKPEANVRPLFLTSIEKLALFISSECIWISGFNGKFFAHLGGLARNFHRVPEPAVTFSSTPGLSAARLRRYRQRHVDVLA